MDPREAREVALLRMRMLEEVGELCGASMERVAALHDRERGDLP